MAAVSLEARHVLHAQERITAILAESTIVEFKSKKLAGAKHRLGAFKLIEFLFSELLPLGTRVDVLIWDTQDERHSVPGRDDTKNDARMFFHLHKQLMCRRPAGKSWHLRPDQRIDMDWGTLRQCLDSVGNWRRYFEQPLLAETFTERFFEIRSMEERDSRSTPLCQIADYFAGMACFSRREAEKIAVTLRADQGTLFGDVLAPRLSNADVERIEVIKQFYSKCRENRLGVSLRTSGYLETKDPSNPINFWHYRRQHANDIAPMRNG
jgi:hypothetical protein